MSSNVRGGFLALLAFAIFSAHDVIVKVLGAFYTPFQIVFFGVLFSFPLASLMLIQDPRPGHLRPVHPGWTGLRTVATVATGVCAFFAFSTLPLAQVYAILFAMPLLITVLSIPVLGERVGPRRGVAVLVGLVGVLVVLRPGATELQVGHLAALAAAVCGAAASVIVRKIGHAERSVVLLLYPMLLNFALTGMLMPWVYEPMPGAHLLGLALLAVLAFAASALVIFAYRAGEAVVVAPMQYSQMLWAALYGAVFFDEFPDVWTVLGAGIIIASGIYILMRERDGRVSEHRPVSASRLRPDTGVVPRLGVLRRARAVRKNGTD